MYILPDEVESGTTYGVDWHVGFHMGAYGKLDVDIG